MANELEGKQQNFADDFHEPTSKIMPVPIHQHFHL